MRVGQPLVVTLFEYLDLARDEAALYVGNYIIRNPCPDCSMDPVMDYDLCAEA